MKLEKYFKKLEQDTEYLAAKKELKPLLDLADDVLRLRLDKGWSQSELARRAGTRQTNISRLESGLANPTYRFLKKIADALGNELEIRIPPRKIEFTKVIAIPIPIPDQESPWEKKRRATTWKDRATSPMFRVVQR